MPLPDLNTVPHFYHGYIRQITAQNAHEATSGHLQELIDTVTALPEAEWSYSYAPGKWSIKEMVQHIIDAERIFSHRALSIARQDTNSLPGFDEESYAAVSGANERSGQSLVKELEALNTTTECLFSSFNDEQLSATGIANSLPISVNAIAFIIAGHAKHHTGILRSRYLDKSYRHEA